MRNTVYLNGQILPAGEARIDPSDQGFLCGAGLFETMRAYGGRIFLLDKHVRRLLVSARVFGIGSLDESELECACSSVVEANKLDSARIRLTVSRGEGTGAKGRPTVLVQARPYTSPASEKYRTGFRAVISEARRHSKSLLVRHKTTSYVECVMARELAVSAGYDEALFLNEAGNLTEGSISNLFLVDKNGKLVTPPLEAGLLAGVTRGWVLETAETLGFDIEERNVSPDEADDFSAAFITNSLIEIMPLASITGLDGKEHSFSARGAADRLLEFYSQAALHG
jgi:branched-chain amino acid aminotransferase